MVWRGWGVNGQSIGNQGGDQREVAPGTFSGFQPPANVLLPAAPPQPLRALAKSSTPPSSPISHWLKKLHAKYQSSRSGKLASYIPELTKANPNHFGVALTTADGQFYAVGDSDVLFTIQSISKPLVYGLALEDHGSKEVLRKVGVEPTGEAFNSIVMDELNNRPFNPMVNAGAIATTVADQGSSAEERFGASLTCSAATPAAS